MVMGGVIKVNVIMIPARVARLTKRRGREWPNCIHTYFVFNYSGISLVCTGEIWKTIRRAVPKKSSCTTHYTKDPSILANEFNQFFILVNAAGKSAELTRSLGLTDYLPSCSNNSPKSGEGLFDFKPASCSDVREVLTVMLSNKAPGYDRIPLFVIKDCLPYILPTLTRLMNSSFD